MSLKSWLYRLLRWHNDLSAIQKGPKAIGKRIARKGIGRFAGENMSDYKLFEDFEGQMALVCWLLVCILVYLIGNFYYVIALNVLFFGGFAFAEKIVGHRI